jgi:hypothetical protein
VFSVEKVKSRLAVDEILKSGVTEADVTSANVFVMLSVIITVCNDSPKVIAVDEATSFPALGKFNL